MPRHPRLLSKSGIEHVMLRGVNKQTIFRDDADCRKFLKCLWAAQEKGGFTLHAYCLMKNHVHLLIQRGKETVGQSVKRFGISYAAYYNKKYDRVGHLFQDRYRSVPVETEASYLNVIRYIMQNPVKAGICLHAADYKWSNYRSLGENDGIADSRMLKSIFAEEDFLEYINQPVDDAEMDSIERGRQTDSDVVEMLKELTGVKSAEEFLKLDGEKKAEYIRRMKDRGCRYKQIAKALGVSMDQLEVMRGLKK